ncbi:MAG TPA: CHAT domain-containing tetratricopeptide repeat protein [Chitinophaga sp.]|uniref:CHAT domain-containing protein n=1 Tax=Chitinophaga sp. TaxID=1869181 RepID=UPI002C1A28A2|nr:CHAT domain-containing tetratricopeptide repeat protein [Chitinophaga sp.]HVI47188.1 CHAT domain-containing tetratricopeptide repeat protein [Chitinophaga sp.]
MQLYLRKKALCILLTLYGCVQGAFYVHAQCPTPAVFMDSILRIEQSDAARAVKITQLQTLLAKNRQCTAVKDSIYARIMHRLGDLYHFEGDWSKAIGYTKEAVDVNSHSKAALKPFLVNSYYNLAVFYSQLHLYAEAHHYYDSCILAAMPYPGKLPIALLAFENKSFNYYETGDYQQGAETADLGVLVARSINDTLAGVKLLVQKAQSLSSINDTAGARTAIDAALEMLPSQAPVLDKANCYAAYAGILGKERKYRDAIAYYQRALAANRSIQWWDLCARNLIDLGNLYSGAMKDGVKAMRCYQESVRYAEKSGDPYLLAGVCNNIGYGYWTQHQSRKALSFYQKALNTLPMHFSDTSLRSNPGYDLLRNAANDYLVFTFLANKGESLLALFKETRDSSWLRYALSTFRTADFTVDMMRWKQYGEPSLLFWRNRTRKMYELAVETCYLLHDAPAAFRFFEKSRAVLLNDKLNELGARRYLSPADIAKEQALRIQIVALQQQLNTVAAETPSWQQYQRQLLNARSDLEKFIRNLEKEHPAYYQYKYDTAVLTVADIRKNLLQDGKTLVEYFTTDSSVFILSVSANACSLHRTTFNPKDLDELVQLCTNATMLSPQHERYCVLAYQLYRQWFAPLPITGSRIIISPDEYLIPFEALLSDSTDQMSYLIKRYAFSYTYAARSLMKPHPVTQYGSHDLLGIAPVHYAAYLQQSALNGADQSLGNIRKSYGTSLCLTDASATKQRFLTELPRSRVVQLYSHASASGPDKEPVLYLADSALRLPEIQLLQDSVTSLIILSTCEAGLGRHAGGEGVLSLARGFALTGIPSILTTLWQIDNEATYELTESFHQHLDQGLEKDVALQQAKLRFLENNDKGSLLPYYWAASILFGETAPLPPSGTTGSHTGFLITAALIAAALLLILLFYKKSK